ncbi:MAG: hypothetical protein B7X33_00005, partial [Lysobacterales bacterium 13-68-4]
MSISITTTHSDRADRRTVFLPVTRPVVSAFLTDGAIPELAIERAALLVLMLFRERRLVTSKDVCDALSDAEAAFLANPDEAGITALRESRSHADDLDEDSLSAVLRNTGLTLVEQEEMNQELWRGPLGRFHPVFQERCKSVIKPFEFNAGTERMTDAQLHQAQLATESFEAGQTRRAKVAVRSTDDQARFITKVAADPEELHVLQGYAGTGKTHLTVMLHQHLGKLTHVLLRASDAEAFKERTGLRDIKTLTLGNLARRMVFDQFRGRLSARQCPPPLGTGHLDLPAQADEIGVPRSGVGQKSAPAVMGDLIKVVRRFCRTDATEIDPIMFVGLGYDATDLQLVTALAQRLWQAMFEPLQVNAPQPFSLWEYHLAKWLALRGARIPPMGMLVIDEGHDLSPAWIQLMSTYADGLLLMGDPYQRLSGIARAPERAITSSIGQSVRTGQQAIPMIKGVLRGHSETLMSEDLRGSREHDTRVRSYTQRDEVRDVGLRVYGSIWQLFADAMRMRESGNAFSILPVSFDALKAVLTDALTLYRYGDKPRRRELEGIRSRDALDAHLAAIGQDKIRRMLAKGFTFDDA